MSLKLTIGKSSTDFSGGDSKSTRQVIMDNREQQESKASPSGVGSGAGLWRSLRLLAGLVAVAMVIPGQSCGQSSAARTAPPPDRCLLIVETSKSMQRRADAVLAVVLDLLRSGLNGQLQGGDTLGVWTFNEDLYAGRFPLQQWSSQTQQDVARRVLTFLMAQKYEKQARLDKVLPTMTRVIKDSDRITVILISSGDDSIKGTPFDARINEYYQRWREQQQKARMPFVIALRAQDGLLADYAMNTPPWPVQLPRMLVERKPIATAQGDVPKAAPTNPPPAVPPLIVSGKKPQPKQAETPKAEPVPTQAALAPTVGVTMATNEPVEAKPGEPTVQPAEVAKAESTPSVPTMAATERAANPVESAQAKPETVSPPPATTPKPEPAAAEEPKPSPVLQEKTATPSATAVAPEPASATVPQPAPSQSTTTGPAPLAPRTAPLPTPPVQDAAAAPAGTFALHLNLWIAGLVLAVIAAVTAFLLLRRSRATPQGSFITRSFEREKKP